MINPTDAPVDVEEVRLWANGYRDMQTPPLSWVKFGKECDVPAGTLQPFCKGNYAGDNEGIARKIFRFMQTVESRQARQQAIPTDPGYFHTETSLRLLTLLQIAHMGRITVGATGPGTGKTKTIEEYAASTSQVWVATMAPTTKRLMPMMMEVQSALGLEPRMQWPVQLSKTIMERMRGRRGLLVIDEANYLDIESIEEIRSWYDKTGVGICLLGNEELIARIETGRQRDRYARLNRRIAMRHVQRVPLPNDVIDFCDAWKIEDPAIRAYLEKVALMPDVGGLGECQQLIEAGSMIAAGEERGLTIADLREAQQTRATRWLKV